MKENKSVKILVLNSLFIALVFLTTYFTRIPTPLPGGYFNLGDSMIMLAAVFLGPISGMIAGAVGSAVADLAAGALLFAPITFLVKGVEGLAVGLLARRLFMPGSEKQPDEIKNSGSFHLRLAIAIITGAVIMIAGYFLAEAFILGIFDDAFGVVAAVGELLPNTAQGVLSAILGYILVLVLSKLNIGKYIR